MFTGIPSNGGLESFEIPVELGMTKLMDNMNAEVVCNIVDGMLFSLAARDLPAAQTDEERMVCHAKSLVLRELKGMCVTYITQRDERN